MTAPGVKLWYQNPAAEVITEALPLGNGRLGALITGGVPNERLALNEATLWSGGPYDATSPEALASLPEVRRLLFAGRYREAAELAQNKLMARPIIQASYQPLADLWLEFEGHERQGYERELDLETALATTRYSSGGVGFTRECFISAADDVLVLRVTASEPGKLECVLRLTSQQRGRLDWQRGVETWHTSRELGMRGRNRGFAKIDGDLELELALRVRLEGGRAMPGEERLSLREATSVVVVGAAATSYVDWRGGKRAPREQVKARLDAVEQASFEALRARHLQDYQPKFRRLHIDLGRSGDRAQIATDARVAAFADGLDPELAALYVQYGRYLLLACSRPGGQAATLQGLWNDKPEPPWGSKYTININTEMNYWPALPGALPECDEPLFALVEDLAESGQHTARVHYGAGGWVAHHNVDLWRATAPIDGAEWGLWPTGGAWLCLQLWDHYRFTEDVGVLGRVYPLLRGAAQFFLDTLLPHPDTGHLVTCPSISPENQHPHGTALCAGPTMDNAILRDLFDATAEAAQRLGVDVDFRARVQAARERLPPYRIGRGGQLQEWLDDWDLDAPEPNHRHVSHLFGLHPSQQISPQRTPELAAAARRSLELRGDAGTGWSLAWKLNLWARLHDAERAYTLLQLLLSPERTYTNLFDAHPPFQIDGNFGATAGVLEMLVQSEPGRLHLLPALPEAWPSGSLRGVRARGGLQLDFSWREGQVVALSITSQSAQRVELQLGAAPPAQVALDAGTNPLSAAQMADTPLA
ncbi:MAG: glycoside hydrolase family 95 protein [Myxococcales bacterium]